MQLEDTVAIVTGAADGIGRACATGFAQRGAAVVAVDLPGSALTDVVAQIEGDGGAALAVPVPVGTEEAAHQITATALDRFGRIDALVNNAAVGGDTVLRDLDADHLEQALRINLAGPMLLAREVVARSMIPRSYGRIVSLTSRSGLRGKFGESVYGAAKAGLVGASLCWALELMEHRITVNCVAPAAWTRLLEVMPEPEKTRTIEKRKHNALGRVAMPDDVVPTLAFLCSRESEYLTGQVVEATGQPIALL